MEQGRIVVVVIAVELVQCVERGPPCRCSIHTVADAIRTLELVLLGPFIPKERSKGDRIYHEGRGKNLGGGPDSSILLDAS